MPFPALLLWGAAAAVAGVGIKKGYDAYSDNSKAKEIGERAESIYHSAERSLEVERENTQRALEELGKIKVEVFSNQIKHLVEMQKKFGSKISSYNQDVYIDDLPSVEVMVEKSLEVEKGIGSGAVGGALAALGAYGSIGAFATASTGTAIGALSGAAATNATLAWLGGGSLAAGGFGVAGGMVALGGIALAPLLAIGGFWAASKAEEALTNAYGYRAKVDEAVEKIETLKTLLKAIQRTTTEMKSVIREMVQRFEEVKVFNIDDKEAFTRMFLVGKGLKQILDTPIMNSDGTAKENIRLECSGYLALGNIH